LKEIKDRERNLGWLWFWRVWEQWSRVRACIFSARKLSEKKKRKKNNGQRETGRGRSS
jgi:hypothetical protein